MLLGFVPGFLIGHVGRKRGALYLETGDAFALKGIVGGLGLVVLGLAALDSPRALLALGYAFLAGLWVTFAWPTLWEFLRKSVPRAPV